MVEVKQFGVDGRTYDTNDYPYILIERNNSIISRFSTIEKAHEGRLMTALNKPNEIILLMNEKTRKFIDWRKKERILFQKYKDDPSEYFDRFFKRRKIK